MPGPRVYTVEQIDELIPDLEGRFKRLDEIREKIRRLKIKVDALEMIWGEQVHRPECPDHKELEHHVEGMKELEENFQRETASFGELGATMKGLDPGLVDFYGVHDGFLVFLCWKRGEKSVEFWHHIDAGFSGRQPL